MEVPGKRIDVAAQAEPEKKSARKYKKNVEEVRKCKKHDGEVIELFCCTHDSVGCELCMKLEHGKCKKTEIKTKAKNFRNEDSYERLFKSMDMFKSIKSECKKRIENNENAISLLRDKALKDIRTFREEINALCDKAEKEIQSEVTAITSENMELHKRLVDDIKALFEDMEDVQKKLEDTKQSEQAAFIQAVNSKHLFQKIEMKYANLQHTKDLNQFSFVEAKDVLDILKSSSKLGRLQIHTGMNRSSFVVGTRVARGPNWKNGVYNEKDCGGTGTVTRFGVNGRAFVQWDLGGNGVYKIGQENVFDLTII